MTNYKKHFGTPEKAAFSVYVLDCEDGIEIDPALCVSVREHAGSIDALRRWLESEADDGN